MLMILQEEFETLEKNNEEKLSMLRAENAYMKRKLNEETTLNTTSYEIVQPRPCIHQSTYNEDKEEATRNIRHIFRNICEKTSFFLKQS